MSKLKPCPFCGGTAHLKVLTHHNGCGDITITQYTVCCDASGDRGGCGANCGWLNYSREEATATWNRRVGEADADTEV